MENGKGTVRLCFSFLEERVFLMIALLEMDLNSFFHGERTASCSAVGGVDKRRERSLALQGTCMAKE